jgi:hypothetical protein
MSAARRAGGHRALPSRTVVHNPPSRTGKRPAAKPVAQPAQPAAPKPPKSTPGGQQYNTGGKAQ